MQRYTTLRRKTPLRAKGKSDVAVVKESIQALLRELVIARDGGCILRDLPDSLRTTPEGYEIPPCNGYRNDGELILQCDHLVSRAHSATYADPRLCVCLCKGHHGWKSVGGNARKAQYDEIVHHLIDNGRVALWMRAEAAFRAHKPYRFTLSDWQKQAAFLRAKVDAL